LHEANAGFAANLQEIRHSGSHFEPRLVEAFAAILPQILEIQAAWNDREAEQEKVK
jgi:response regulator RpfG family c-di-GMP phosphodiesterase